MKKSLLKVFMSVMVISTLWAGKVKAEDVEKDTISDIILVTGKVVEIKYSENPESVMWEECTDRLYFDVDGYIYEVWDFAEDMFIDDDVLICIDTKGTESQKDDVIMMWRYWRPDLRITESESLPKDNCKSSQKEIVIV